MNYTALQTIKLNGRWLSPEDTFDVEPEEEEEAARLVDLGAAQLSSKIEFEKKNAPAPISGSSGVGFVHGNGGRGSGSFSATPSAAVLAITG